MTENSFNKIFNERYFLEEILLTGKDSTRYRAKDKVTNSDVILIAGKENIVTEQDYYLISMAQLVELNHPNIDQPLEYGYAGDVPFVVYQMLSGLTLEGLIRDRVELKQPFSKQEIDAVIKPLTDTQMYLMQNSDTIFPDENDVFFTTSGQMRLQIYSGQKSDGNLSIEADETSASISSEKSRIIMISSILSRLLTVIDPAGSTLVPADPSEQSTGLENLVKMGFLAEESGGFAELQAFKKAVLNINMETDTYEHSESIFREFWDFLKYSKSWWLTPILILLALVALLIIVNGVLVQYPAIYTLF